jgi:hypothetical protein
MQGVKLLVATFVVIVFFSYYHMELNSLYHFLFFYSFLSLGEATLMVIIHLIFSPCIIFPSLSFALLSFPPFPHGGE